MSDEQELKPCYKCNKMEREIIQLSDTGDSGHVEWEAWRDCECSDIANGPTREEAIRIYNIREAEDIKDARIAELEQQLAEANKTIEARTEAVRILDNEVTGLEKQLAEARKVNLRQRVEDIRMCSDPLYPAGFKIKDVVVTKDFKDNLITNLEFIFEVPCSDFIEGMTDKLLPSRDIVDHLIEHGVEGNNE
jgi:uncharacterized coiled-coil protein SlyX